VKSLIVCVSISNGNTRRVADRMAEVLNAEVVEPEAVDLAALHEYDIVGFGSGIYFNAVHSRLRRLVHSLPHVDGGRAFTFFTSGGPDLPLAGYSRPIRHQLASTGSIRSPAAAWTRSARCGSSAASTRDGQTTATSIVPRRSRCAYGSGSRARRALPN